MIFTDKTIIKLDNAPATGVNPVAGSIYEWITLDESDNMVINYRLSDGTDKTFSGGGGSTYTAGTGIDITDNVISATGGSGESAVYTVTPAGSPLTATVDRTNGDKQQVTITAQTNIEFSNLGDQKETRLKIINGGSNVAFPVGLYWDVPTSYSLSGYMDYNDYVYKYNLNQTATKPPVLQAKGYDLFSIVSSTYNSSDIKHIKRIGYYTDQNAIASDLLINFNASPFVDSSANASTITDTGITLDTTNKKFGAGSGSFDGTKYISPAVIDGLKFGTGSGTIDFWMKSSTADCDIWSMRGSIDGMGITSGAIWWYNNAAHNGSIIVTDGNWHHVAWVRSQGVTTVYIDGKIDQQCADTYNYNSIAEVHIGHYFNQNIFFTGNLDAFRVTKGIARWLEPFDVSEFTQPTI